jgi:hypothetical protein
MRELCVCVYELCDRVKGERSFEPFFHWLFLNFFHFFHPSEDRLDLLIDSPSSGEFLGERSPPLFTLPTSP